MTVGELLGRISSEELTEWMALGTVEAEEQRIAELEAKVQSRMNRG